MHSSIISINSFLFLILSLIKFGGAQSTASSAVVITPATNYTAVANPGNQEYEYVGCYNETSYSAGLRALYQGTVTSEANMTVNLCLDLCVKPGSSNVPGSSAGYIYAGLEYTQECWCSVYLDSASTQVNQSECNLPCIGNTSELCGGPLKLSLYKMKSAAVSKFGVLSSGLGAVMFLSMTFVVL